MRLGFLYQSIWIIIFLFTLSDIQAANIKRAVLGFWDSTEYEYKDSSANHIHQNLEVVLNHYGLKVEYIDVAKELPKELVHGISNIYYIEVINTGLSTIHLLCSVSHYIYLYIYTYIYTYILTISIK